MFGGVTSSLTSPARGTASPRPAVSSAGQDEVADVLDELDFDSPEAVQEAHGRIAQTPALVRFCDKAFDDVDKPRSLDALTTLFLYKGADARQQSRPAIAQRRDDALATLAARLSPVGKEELQQALDTDAGRHGFCQYLAPADRWCLAGHVSCTHPGPESHRQAANAYLKAAEGYTRTGAYPAAAAAHLRVARLRAAAGHNEAAAAAYAAAAVAYTVANLPGQALDAWLQAAKAARAVADTCPPGTELAGDGCTAVAEAARAAAQLATTERPSQAAECFQMAAEASCAAAKAYSVAQLPGQQALNAWQQAVDAYLNAAEGYTRTGAYPAAAAAHLRIAQLRAAAGHDQPAAAAYAAAAVAYAVANLPGQALDAWLQAAEAARAVADTCPPGTEPAGDGYTAVAEAALAAAQLATTQRPSKAAECFQMAADASCAAAQAYSAAQLPDQQALNAWRQTADAWRRAADAHTGQGQSARAKNARKAALAAWHEIARIYVKREQYEAAASAYKRAHRFRSAAEALASAALILRDQRRHKESGDTYRRASEICRMLAQRYTECGLADWTREALERAGTLCTMAAISYERSDLIKDMANAWNMSAKCYYHASKVTIAHGAGVDEQAYQAANARLLENARCANEFAADCCMRTQQYLRAANIYTRLGRRDLATQARELAEHHANLPTRDTSVSPE